MGKAELAGMSVADDNRWEMIRRLRLGNLRTLFRDRYGSTLPDDDAGREDLHELLLPISVGPHADIKMHNAIQVWAPWMQPAEATELIDEINRTPIWRRKPSARQLGQRLRVTNGERERLKLWTIAPYNMNRQELLLQRKAKAKARMRLLRQLRGSKRRAEYEATSTNRTKPWIAAGISRATWYRQRETSPCAVRLVKAANALVSPQQAKPHKKERATTHAVLSKPSKPTKAEKPQSTEQHTADAVTDRELCERTCLTSTANEPVQSGNGWWRNSRTPDEQLDPERE